METLIQNLSALGNKLSVLTKAVKAMTSSAKSISNAGSAEAKPQSEKEL